MRSVLERDPVSDLPGIDRYGNISDEAVLGFARAM